MSSPGITNRISGFFSRTAIFSARQTIRSLIAENRYESEKAERIRQTALVNRSEKKESVMPTVNSGATIKKNSSSAR